MTIRVDSFTPKVETIDRALVDLETLCSKHNVEREAQRITDMEREVIVREREVQKLEVLREDALAAATFVAEADPALAFIFEQRAGMLLEEITRARPVALRLKLEEAKHAQRRVQLIAQALDKLDVEALHAAQK